MEGVSGFLMAIEAGLEPSPINLMFPLLHKAASGWKYQPVHSEHLGHQLCSWHYSGSSDWYTAGTQDVYHWVEKKTEMCKLLCKIRVWNLQGHARRVMWEASLGNAQKMDWWDELRFVEQLLCSSHLTWNFCRLVIQQTFSSFDPKTAFWKLAGRKF